jgi:hypothetical protein
MNRRMRRSLGKEEVKQAQSDAWNAYHWGAIKDLKREYDRLTPEEQAERKARMACEIDEHLDALKAL